MRERAAFERRQPPRRSEREQRIDLLGRFLRRKEQPIPIADRLQVKEFLQGVRQRLAENDPRFLDEKVWTDDALAELLLESVHPGAQPEGEVVPLPERKAVQAEPATPREYVPAYHVGHREQFNLNGRETDWRMIKILHRGDRPVYVFYPHQEANVPRSTDDLVREAEQNDWILDAEEFDHGRILSATRKRAV